MTQPNLEMEGLIVTAAVLTFAALIIILISLKMIRKIKSRLHPTYVKKDDDGALVVYKYYWSSNYRRRRYIPHRFKIINGKFVHIMTTADKISLILNCLIFIPIGIGAVWACVSNGNLAFLLIALFLILISVLGGEVASCRRYLKKNGIEQLQDGDSFMNDPTIRY